MTIFQVLQWGITQLKHAKVESPALDAEVLLAQAATPLQKCSIEHFCNVRDEGRAWLYGHPEQHISKTTVQQFNKLVRRRTRREPVAYILGHKEFYGLDFLVNKSVLVPRPESELLVEQAIREIRNSSPKANPPQEEKFEIRRCVVDIGTGCGCLIIALAKASQSQFPVSNFKFLGVDISADALRLARENARRHGVEKRIKFLCGNLLEPIMRGDFCTTPNPSSPPKADPPRADKRRGNGSIFLPCLPPGDPPQGDPRGGLRRGGSNHIIITANLPYLSTSEWRATAPEIRKWEPRQALDGGKDGLKYYRKMFRQLKQFATCYMLHVTCLCELCPEQVLAFRKMVRRYFPRAKFRVIKDLSGRNRVVIVRI